MQINGVARVGDDGAHVAGEEILALADAEHQRAAAPRADDESGRSWWIDGDAVGADDLLQGAAQRLDEARLRGFAPLRVVIFADQMRQHLGVGLRIELVAFAQQVPP